MPCFRPLRAYRVAGGVSFSERAESNFGASPMMLPCGRCAGCKLERSRQWAVRCVHEAQMHTFNCAITLTYSDEHLPGPSLVYEDFQLFLKRLRKHYPPRSIRYFGCGEYGERRGRPHFHALLFGVDFRDKIPDKDTSAGSKQWISAFLDSVWGFGRCTVGEASFETAAYIARYCLDKITGPMAADHYRRVDESSGEITYLEPEFNFMSLKPGIGATWLDRFGRSDVFPHDRVVSRGFEAKPPRYYDKRLSEVDPERWKEVKYAREERAFEFLHDSTPDRLAVRETVAVANLKRFARGLKK